MPVTEWAPPEPLAVGAGRAWRVGWLVARLLMSLVFLLLFVVLGIVGLTSDDVSGSVVVVSAVFTIWFALGVWRYAWRLLRLRDAAASFVALTPGGVRVVDATSYASVPWRVIQQATLHTEGRRNWLCLGIDASAPADISWAVLRAPVAAQVLPGRTVLWLRLPKDEADPRRLGPGLWVGGNIPFNAGFWPGPVARQEPGRRALVQPDNDDAGSASGVSGARRTGGSSRECLRP